MTSRAVNKDIKSKSKISDNYGHNNLGFLMFHQILLSPQVKRGVIISKKHGVDELPHKLLNELKFDILEY